MMQRPLFLTVLLGLTLNALGQSTSTPSLRITNEGPTAFASKVVEIPWETVLKAYPKLDTAQLKLVDHATKKEIAYQYEHRGDKAIHTLLVQVSVNPKQSLQLDLLKGKPAPVSPQTYCRYVPERFEDFAWENDRVAFRIYGAALNGRSDNGFGNDIWAKRTNQLILDKWYKLNNYHADNGEGLDYYHVGLTLGAGDLGVFLGDTINYVHNYRSWEILDNGPLRSTFRVKYDTYSFGNVKVTEIKTISLDAGSQLSRISVNVVHTAPKALPMVAGISLRAEPGQLLLDDQTGILGYWEPRHGNDGTIGVGCIFPNLPVSMISQFQHGLAKFSVASGTDLVYYTGGDWDKAGRITSGEAWFAYLRQYMSQLKNPLRVSTGK